MSMCDNCKYYKVEFAPYIKQRILTCTYKGQHCAKSYKQYTEKKKKEGKECLTKT